MSQHSAIHFYVNWAKERIDEMDATLASFEAKVSELQADTRAKANQALADMRKKRDDFRDTLKKQADANEAVSVKRKHGSNLNGTRSRPTSGSISKAPAKKSSSSRRFLKAKLKLK